MKHSDFDSLELKDVVGKILRFSKEQSGARSVQWISAFGLQRILTSSIENWQWAFASVDIVGTHVTGLGSKSGEAELFDVWQLWRQVTAQYPVLKNAKVMSMASGEVMVWPLFSGEQLLGYLAFEGLAKDQCPAQATAKLEKGLTIGKRYLQFAYQLLDARNQSYVDELTGLYNQRHLPRVLGHEIERSRRDKTRFSLLFMDIDYFKMVNDGKGHWVGSKLLGELAKVLLEQIRHCDHAFRYGGDEFIVMLGGANQAAAHKVAERIRLAVESHAFLVDGHDLKLTVSIGLAEYPGHAQTAEGLIQLADQAMYFGKRKSRNIVFIAS